jgi:hypothetical protein
MHYGVSSTGSVSVIDLKLAASYAPGIICVGKSVMLVTFCHVLSEVLLLNITEKCILVVIILYLDRAHHKEHIVDTNACVGVTFFGLIVNELRSINTFSVPLLPVTVIFSAVWWTYSCLVLQVGEQCITRVVQKFSCSLFTHCISLAHTVYRITYVPRTSQGLTEVLVPEKYDKNSDGKKQSNTHFIPLLITAVLLYLTCNSPVFVEFDSTVETVTRVFCFVSSSLLWLYTLNVEQMQPNTIASFTPCINRFMALLLTGPLVCMVAVYFVMISLVVYRGWDTLSTAMGSASAAASAGVSDAGYVPTRDVNVKSPHEEARPARPSPLPAKNISVLGLPSHQDDVPFDPEAAFAEMTRSKAMGSL